MGLADEIAAVIGPAGNEPGCVRVSEGIVQVMLFDRNWYFLSSTLEFVHRHMKHLDVGDVTPAPDPTPVPDPTPAPPPEPEPEPEPTPEPDSYQLEVKAPSMQRVNVQSMGLENDHINVWGRPGEAIEFTIHADQPCRISTIYDYVLAEESSTKASTREEKIGESVNRISFPPTTGTWAQAVQGTAPGADEFITDIPAGDTVISLTNNESVDWSNWLDLYCCCVFSTKPVTLVADSPEDPPHPPPLPVPDPVPAPPPDPDTIPPTPNPAPSPLPPPVAGNYDVIVGRDGSLQQLLDRGEALQREWKIGVPSGVHDGAIIVNKQYKALTLFLEDGAIIRGASGIEGYGGIENLRITCNPRKAFIEADGNFVFSEGIFFDSTRGDKGGNNQPGGNIVVENVVVQPIQGTGLIQRNGIGIWGCDRVQVIGVEVHHASGNAVFGFGTAGSLISIGHAKRNTRVSGQFACRLINNLLYSAEISDDNPSADRNGIILDLFHGGGGSRYDDYVIGPILIENNEINNVAGRGIQMLFAGLPDAPVLCKGNKVSGRYAYGLGDNPHEGNPKVAIGGYGGGICSSVTVVDNVVDTSRGEGKPAYGFESFDGGDGSGVKGSNNKGTPVYFYNSPNGENIPAGFSS